jgi:tetratricopeptide (TPR) repeat protein/DNA-binding SARP family transcriptional activator
VRHFQWTVNQPTVTEGYTNVARATAHLPHTVVVADSTDQVATACLETCEVSSNGVRRVDIVFGILGRTALRIDGDLDETWGSARLRAMLATLLVHAGRSVPIDTMVAWIWPEESATPQNAASTFHTYATRIRAALRRLPRPPTLHVENGSYRLDVDKSLIDYSRFRALIGQARACARTEAYQEAAGYAERALTLWRGRALEDLKGEPARAWRTRVLWDEWMPANVIHIEVLIQLGEFGESLTRLDELKTEFGHDVTLAELRLSALHGLSRYAEATAHYLGMRRILLDEVDEQAAEHLREHYENLRAKSTPAESATLREPAIIPRQLPRDIAEFVGRDDLLEALVEATRRSSDGNSSRVITIDGMAGVGKTALAVHWGHRVRDRFPGGDLFVDLQGYSDSVDVVQSSVVDEFLTALGSPSTSDLSPRAKELLLKRLMADRQALVVLDNARNTGHVEDLVALLLNCTIVVTSRQQLTKLRVATGARRVHVGPMTRGEASDLLSARLDDLPGINPDARDSLANLCGGLPLVITVLAQHIASRPPAHFDEFTRQLDRRQLITDIGEDGDGSATAETLFHWSYRALGAPERRLFRLLSMNPGPDVGETVARVCDGRATAEVKRSLRILVAAHLLEQPKEFNRYQFHDLIREFARHRLEVDEPSAERATVERRLLSHYLSTATDAHRTLYPGNLVANRIGIDDDSELVAFEDATLAKTWFDRERANLVSAIQLAARRGYHEHAWLLTDVVGTFLDRQGHYDASRRVREQAVASAHAAGDRLGEASCLVSLGMVQMILGDHVEARSGLEAALGLVEAEGFERGQASTLHQLGRLEFTRGNPELAVEFYRRCLDIARRIEDSEALCWTHCHIGEALRILNRHDEALAHLDECQVHARRIGEDSADASSMVEKGSIYRDRGDYAGAVAQCEGALRIVESMPTPDLAIMTSAYIALAEVRIEQDDVESSTRDILRAVKLAQDAHNTTAEAYAQEVYGDIQSAAGARTDAVRTWEVAADLYEHIGNISRMGIVQNKIDSPQTG